MSFESFGQWLNRRYPGYPTDITLGSREIEERLVRDHPQLLLGMPRFSYARYGYTLSNFWAHNAAMKFGALEMDFHARLTNCGMAGICSVIETAEPDKHKPVIKAEVLYSETAKRITKLRKQSIPVFSVPSQDTGLVISTIEHIGPKLVILETVGNGIPMPVLDLKAILWACWEREMTLVIDNTLLSPACSNPFSIYASVAKDCLCKPTMALVIVESLTKHYHCEEGDPVTAGIVYAPREFIARLDDTIMQNGAYLQYSALEKLPADPAAVLEQRMKLLCRNARAAAEVLRHHGSVRKSYYPDKELGADCAGGVLFLELDTDDRQEASRRLTPVFGPYKGSFGHPCASWIPFGQFYESDPPGLVRLAVGWKETPEELIGKLAKALKKD